MLYLPLLTKQMNLQEIFIYKLYTLLVYFVFNIVRKIGRDGALGHKMHTVIILPWSSFGATPNGTHSHSDNTWSEIT